MYYTNEELYAMDKGKLIELLRNSYSIKEKERSLKKNSVLISSGKDIYYLLRRMKWDKYRENFFLFRLTAGLRLLQKKLLFQGNEARVEDVSMSVLFKEIFSIKDSCCKIIVAHNHPSGETTPSQSDLDFTSELKKWCKKLGIELLDHIIFTTDTYISLEELKKV